jgi:hypothetical protein
VSFVSDSELVTFIRDTEYELSLAGFHFRGYAAERRQRLERRSVARPAERRGFAFS